MRYVESKLMKNWRYQELERSSGSTFLPLICPVPLVPRQPTHTECHCRSSLTRRDTKLAFYIHLDMHLDYEKSEGQLPRSTRSSSRPRPVKDLFVNVQNTQRRKISSDLMAMPRGCTKCTPNMGSTSYLSSINRRARCCRFSC